MVSGTECRPHWRGVTAAEVPARWRRSHCAPGTLAIFWDAYAPPRVCQCPGRGSRCWHRGHTTAHWRVAAAGVVAGALQCAAAISSTPGALLSGALARPLSPHSASDRRRGFLTVRRRQSKRSARHTCSCGRSPPSRQRQKIFLEPSRSRATQGPAGRSGITRRQQCYIRVVPT